MEDTPHLPMQVLRAVRRHPEDAAKLPEPAGKSTGQALEGRRVSPST
jgi:hypothetical protein